MRIRTPRTLLLSLLLLGLLAGLATHGVGVAHAILLDQVDDFQDSQAGTAGWRVGAAAGGSTPTRVADGGPLGVGDAFLRMVSTGSGRAASRMTFFNTTARWQGDYTAEAVESIFVRLNNLGSASLTIRLVVESASTPDLPTLDAVVLSPGSGWVEAEFFITPDDLLAGAGQAAQALATVAALRFAHLPNAGDCCGAGIPQIAGTLGVDDITIVPEPRTSLLGCAAVSLVCLLSAGRRFALADAPGDELARRVRGRLFARLRAEP